MKSLIQSTYSVLVTAFIISTISACNPTKSEVQDSYTKATATPTENVLTLLTETSQPNLCNGASGTLEMQVLVGPSEVSGLEPVAVGNLPFSVQNTGEIYLVQGGGNLTYEDVLDTEWGTYSVFLDMEGNIEGECLPTKESATLSMNVSASGDQLVEVRAEGFSGDYPWSGSHEMQLEFPLIEGAQAEGEGWIFILHLNQ